jgi:adenylate cyclase
MLTLNRVFVASLVGLLAGLGGLFWVVFSGLQTALLQSAEQSRERDSAVIGQSVTDYLSQAPAAATDFENLLRAGLTDPGSIHSLRDGLLSVLLANPHISEATFTFARSSGFDQRGHSIVDPASVGQVTLFRPRTGPGFVYLITWNHNGHFLTSHLRLSPEGRESEVEPPMQVPNPADHPTFIGPTVRRWYGTLIWTDIHESAIDAALSESRRRVEVSVQKAIESPPGQFAGVLRLGLFKSAIDDAINMPAAVDTSTHSVFLCDSGDRPGAPGRLIALSGTSHYVDSDGDLRLSSADAPPQVQAALGQPLLATVDRGHPLVSDQFLTSGTSFLYTFRYLPDTQDWIVGMVVPRQAYLGELMKTRAWVIWGSLALAAAIAFFGGIVLHAVSVAHSVILREAALMNDFVLDPSRNSCHFHDINRVLSSLERAKTAMRSMGKYVPMDLVRRLYHRGEEPSLGGETTELSVLFTDIQSFTQFAETTDPDIVAIRLGAYLEVLASVIQGQKGTIDKFIGDSVMAFWNAPEPVPGHPALACRAALAGREALALLYRSPAWEGHPGFETRFGLHHCTASVGHFGSPERFNYTAIGDGINLASRLQSLNKHYGTSIIASDSLRAAAGPGFLWRRLDRVAVKGKTQSLDVYELVGESGGPIPPHVPVYEQALDAWLRGDFQKALAFAESEPGDTPSLFLAARCRQYLASPPAADWDGVYAFDSK